ncbi:RNA-binding protein Lupus La [Tanacetum coccineum]
MPFVPPLPPQMYFAVDPLLHANLVSQIDYYFSNENLVRDTYLRRNMDEQGWVSVLAKISFKKRNSQLLLKCSSEASIYSIISVLSGRRDKINGGAKNDDEMDNALQLVNTPNPTSPQGLLIMMDGVTAHGGWHCMIYFSNSGA